MNDATFCYKENKYVLNNDIIYFVTGLIELQAIFCYHFIKYIKNYK